MAVCSPYRIHDPYDTAVEQQADTFLLKTHYCRLDKRHPFLFRIVLLSPVLLLDISLCYIIMAMRTCCQSNRQACHLAIVEDHLLAP